MQKPLVQNVSDEVQIKNAKYKEKILADNELNDLKFILATEQGRRFIWAVLSDCGIYTESADNSGSWTYYKEGKRSIGLKLLSKIMATDPDSYLRMIKESKKEKI